MKKRIISAIIALAILIPLIILGGKYFIVGIGLLSVLAYKEFLDLKDNAHEIPDLVKGLGLICMLLLVFAEYDGYSFMFGLTYKGLALLFLSLFIPTLFYKNNRYTTKEALYLSGIAVFLGLVFNAIILVRMLSMHKLIYLIAVAILTDTFAMFTGMLIGKHKLCPKISPKKTIEGSVGGSIIGTTVCVIFYSFVISKFTFKLVIVTLLLSILGQLGDLFFSKIKRENNIKDFGNIMPGHGGVLDRIDSFTFVVLGYIILISLL